VLIHSESLDGKLLECPLNLNRVILASFLYDITETFLGSDTFDYYSILLDSEIFDVLIVRIFQILIQ
jgi:hypothetical protein